MKVPSIQIQTSYSNITTNTISENQDTYTLQELVSMVFHQTKASDILANAKSMMNKESLHINGII